MFFTQEDYKKIEEWLSRNAVRDTEFNEAVQPFEGNEIISFVQNGHNTKVYLKDFVNQLFLLGIPDFVNITEKFDESNISLSRAIQLIPYKSRKIGQVITFLNEEGVWKIYQFKGKRKNQWNEESLWIDLIRDIASKITTLADEEDITIVEENGANVFKFKDKTYNPDNFSGKGYKILRKNIVDGKNVLTQEMINEANTVYEIRYDFDLNNETIAIPEGCTLKFEGGSLNNGTIKNKCLFINTINTHNISFIDINEFYIEEIAYNNEEDYGQIITSFLENNNFKKDLILHFRNKNYTFKSSIICNQDITFIGTAFTDILTTNTHTNFTTNDNITILNGNSHRVNISNINFTCKDKVYDGDINNTICGIDNVYSLTLNNCGFQFINIGINFTNTYYNNIRQCRFFRCNKAINISAFTTSLFISNCYLNSLKKLFNLDDGSTLSDAHITFSTLENIEEIINITTTNVRILSITDCYLEGNGKNKEYCISVANKKLEYGVIIDIRNNYISDFYSSNFLYIDGGIFNISNNNINFKFNNYFLYINETATNSIRINNSNNIFNGGGEFVNPESTISYNDTLGSSNITKNCRVSIPSKGKESSIPKNLTKYSDGHLYFSTDTRELKAYNSEYNNWDILNKNDYYNGYNDISESITLTQGYYIRSNFEGLKFGKVEGSDVMFLTNPIKLTRGEIINIGCFQNAGYAGICETNPEGSEYTEIVKYKAEDGTYKFLEYEYEAKKDIYIAISFIKDNDKHNYFRISKAFKYFPYGIRSLRPTNGEGTMFFDKTLNKPIWKNGSQWVDYNGNDADIVNTGTFEQKPDNPSKGFAYFCTDKQTTEGTTNGIIIYHKGNNVWVDALGRVIS